MFKGEASLSESSMANHGDQKMVEAFGICYSVRIGKSTLPVLENVDFFAKQGEIVSIVGPSGCGKSTFLNILAGLIQPDTGTLLVRATQGDEVKGRTGYMQQKDLLLPWRNVLDNVILGLEVQGVSKSLARKRAISHLDEFGLAGFENEYPYALSGGMKQRAAFLRTILTDSNVLLLDEPFGALDALNRTQLHEWLLNLLEAYREKSVVIVTHDVEEALFLSDRLYVMSSRPGTIQMVEKMWLGRPRNRNIVNTPEFVDVKSRILSHLLGVGMI